MRVDPDKFRRLDLRCHGILDDVPLHDVWKIRLEGGGTRRTVSDVLEISPLDRPGKSDPVTAALFSVRGRLGRLFGWDDPRYERPGESYRHRLSAADRARSAVPPGTRRGAFRLLYLLPHEAVAEIHN